MKAALLLMAPLTLAAGAATPVGSLAGHYAQHWREGMVDGTTYRAVDTVDIVPIDSRHAYVGVQLSSYDGDNCGLIGVAEAAGDSLVYRDPPGRGDFEAPCVFTLRHKGNALTIDDRQGSCKAYCGIHAAFDGSLPWSGRRPIADLAGARASRDYRDAVAAWQRARPNR